MCWGVNEHGSDTSKVHRVRLQKLQNSKARATHCPLTSLHNSHVHRALFWALPGVLGSCRKPDRTAHAPRGTHALVGRQVTTRGEEASTSAAGSYDDSVYEPKARHCFGATALCPMPTSLVRVRFLHAPPPHSALSFLVAVTWYPGTGCTVSLWCHVAFH